MKPGKKVFVVFFLLALIGCKYHLLGKNLNLPQGITSIAVRTADNRTMEAGLEQVFTQALVEAIKADGRIKLVDISQAQAVLVPELLEVREFPLAFDRSGRVSLIRVRVIAKLKLELLPDKKIIWLSGELGEDEQYPVGDDFLANERLRKAALSQVCQRLVRIALEKLTSGF